MTPTNSAVRLKIINLCLRSGQVCRDIHGHGCAWLPVQAFLGQLVLLASLKLSP